MGQKLTVIAWLWARTVKSPNPAFAHVDVPLASTFMLSTKPGKEAYVELMIDGGSAAGSAAILAASLAGGTPTLPAYHFTVKVGKPKDAEAAKNGTKLSRGANFQCLMSGTPISGDYVKGEGMAGRIGGANDGDRRECADAFICRLPRRWRRSRTKPSRSGCRNSYPMTHVTGRSTTAWLTLYLLPRQRAAATFSDLVHETREQVKCDASTPGMPDVGKFSVPAGPARSGTLMPWRCI